MVSFKVTSVRSGKTERKINDLLKFLEDPIINSSYNKTVTNLKEKWARDSTTVFNVRRDKGLACDGILAKSLGVEIKDKNSIVVFVEPIIRFRKGTRSSGGPVRNLTSILFRGSGSSFGAWYLRLDARGNAGVHPGISASPMRNLWKRFKLTVRENIREALNRGLARTLKK
jgi:hypothetical protein